MRILLAKDDLIIVDALATSLRKPSFALDHVTNGLDADTASLGQSCDLLILDLGLPRLNGNSQDWQRDDRFIRGQGDVQG